MSLTKVPILAIAKLSIISKTQDLSSFPFPKPRTSFAAEFGLPRNQSELLWRTFHARSPRINPPEPRTPRDHSFRDMERKMGILESEAWVGIVVCSHFGVFRCLSCGFCDRTHREGAYYWTTTVQLSFWLGCAVRYRHLWSTNERDGSFHLAWGPSHVDNGPRSSLATFAFEWVGTFGLEGSCRRRTWQVFLINES